VGQLDGSSCGSAGSASPSRSTVLAREHPQERREPVVPVVVPRQHVHRRRVRSVGQCGPVRAFHAVVVLARRGRGVDLVASEHDHGGAGQRPDRLPTPRRPGLERVGRDQPGDGGGGVEAIAQVCDEVQPQLAARRPPNRERRGLERLLHLALVRVAGEYRRQHHLTPARHSSPGASQRTASSGRKPRASSCTRRSATPPAPPPMRISVPNQRARTCLSSRTSAYGRATAVGWHAVPSAAPAPAQVEHAGGVTSAMHAGPTGESGHAPPPAHLLGDRVSRRCGQSR
jgi:hypothetical protein